MKGVAVAATLVGLFLTIHGSARGGEPGGASNHAVPGAVATLRDGVRATTARGAVALVWTDDAGAAALAQALAEPSDDVARAALALRRASRALVHTGPAAEFERLGLDARLVAVRLANGPSGDATAGTAVQYAPRRTVAPVHLVCPADSPASGRVVALATGLREDARDAAVWFLGEMLVAAHAPQLAGDAARNRAPLGAGARPGEWTGASLDEIAALTRRLASATFTDEQFEAARAALWDGSSLSPSTAIDAGRLAAALATFGCTPDAIGRAALALDRATFDERRAAQLAVDSLRPCTLGPTVPAGAIDLSRAAWERSEPAARERAERLLAALGGAPAWLALGAVRLEVETVTTTQMETTKARSTTLRVLDRALTRVEQHVHTDGQDFVFATGIVGDAVWIRRGENLLELPESQMARVAEGERRALPRVLRALATQRDVGVRSGDGDALVLFDDAGDLCRLELDTDSRVAALVDGEGRSARRFEYEAWEEFAGVLVPTRHREVGERSVEVRVLAFEALPDLDLAPFRSPLQR